MQRPRFSTASSTAVELSTAGPTKPTWHLVSHRHIFAIPHFETCCAIIERYPNKTTTKESCDAQASRDMKSIAAGPLRVHPHTYYFLSILLRISPPPHPPLPTPCNFPSSKPTQNFASCTLRLKEECSPHGLGCGKHSCTRRVRHGPLGAV